MKLDSNKFSEDLFDDYEPSDAEIVNAFDLDLFDEDEIDLWRGIDSEW